MNELLRPVSPLSGEAARQERRWLFDARSLQPHDTALLDAAQRAGCAAMLVNFNQKDAFNHSLPRIVWIDRAEQLDQLAPGDAILSADESAVNAARQAGRTAGCFVEVKDLRAEFPRCEAVVKRGYDFVVVDMYHATYIPFELLVAHIRELPTRIYRVVPIKELQGTVDDVNQSLNAFATLEQGVDVLLASSKVDEIEELGRQVELCQPGQLELIEAEVVSVQHTKMGDRVCVDTTTLMNSEEGMIIGATGWGGIFVCSETHELPHMNLREFRVNAGAVHSYIWGPGGAAIYLSEMRAGGQVLAVDVRGRTRIVTVGRAKIERRPLLLITCKAHWNGQDIEIKTFVQNDWHVRIMGADRKVRNSTLVRPGDKLLAHPDIPGRHTGLRVSETIVEK